MKPSTLFVIQLVLVSLTMFGGGTVLALHGHTVLACIVGCFYLDYVLTATRAAK